MGCGGGRNMVYDNGGGLRHGNVGPCGIVV